MDIDYSIPFSEISRRFNQRNIMDLSWFAERLSNIEISINNNINLWNDFDVPIKPLTSCENARNHLKYIFRIWPMINQHVIYFSKKISKYHGIRPLIYILKTALSLNPLLWNDLDQIHYEIIVRGGIADIIILYEQIHSIHPSIPLHLIMHVGPIGIEAAFQKKIIRQQAGIPGILLNTLPKTGSMFLAEIILKSFDLPWSTTAIQDHALRDKIVKPWMCQLATGGVLSQEHIPGTPETESILIDCGVKHIIIHIRDPRQSLLSCIHHFTKEYKLTKTIFSPYFYDNFPNSSFNERADFMINNYFLEQIEWILGWVRIADSHSPLGIMFSSYEESVSNPSNFIERIIKFYGIRGCDGIGSLADVKPSEVLHFRRGSKDEWRTSFHPDHIAKMQSMMPKYIMNRFGWLD